MTDLINQEANIFNFEDSNIRVITIDDDEKLTRSFIDSGQWRSSLSKVVYCPRLER